MSVNTPRASSNLITKEKLKMFGPVILFSIILPFIDIITDLRMIIRLAFIGIDSCITPSVSNNITLDEYKVCFRSDELSEFCPRNPNLCKKEIKQNFAILLIGKKY